MGISKFVFKTIAIFVVGMVGGIFADQIFWPYFIERPLFYQYRLEQSPIYVTERKQVTIRENKALEEAISKVEKAVVGVFPKGSGLAVTSDGLLVTLNELLPKGSKFYFWVDQELPNWQILKRDKNNNLALVKVEKDNLATLGFADFEKLKVGERVFAVGVVFDTSTSTNVRVNEGIISSISEDFVYTNIFDNALPLGSPLFDIEGRVIGLSLLEADGRVKVIPVNKIKQFIGF